MRLNKFLAKAGVASRRAADLLVEQGRISVNGQTVTKLGVQVDETRDRVAVDGKPARIPGGFVYLMLHKPVSCLVTCKDDFKRPIVLDLVPQFRNIVRPVGRLDYNSSGLLLLTNDGELAFRLTHPRYEISKTYRVKCDGSVSDAALERLRSGVELEDGKTSPAQVELLDRSANNTVLDITIHEGRKRQVRRMCQAVGHAVITLKRIAMGNLGLESLKEGTFRHLTHDEIFVLRSSVNL